MPDKEAGSNASTEIASAIEAATSGVRDTAKWLAGGLGAIGITFAAGAQLTSLGSLTDPGRLALAAGAILIGLLAAALAIARTVDILLPERLNLRAVADLKSDDPVRRFIDANAAELMEGQAATVSGPHGFAVLYDKAIRDRAEAFQRLAADPGSADLKKAAKDLDDRAIYLNSLALKVTAMANYQRLRDGVPGWRKWLIGSALVVAVAIATFSWAANPPDSTDTGMDLRGATLVNADLSKKDLSGADLTGANLTGAVLTNAKLEGAILDRVIWDKTTCPDSVISDAAGGTCVGHLK